MLAFGLEQISNEDTRNDIMDRTYRWFEGWDGTNIESIGHHEIMISPNPANDYILISGANELISVEVFDLAGKLIMTSNLSLIDLASLKNGIYLIKITDLNGISNHKLVKQ